MADDPTFYDEIEAYCSSLSVASGDTIGVHVSSRHGHVDVTVERWGASRTQVYTATALGAEFHPAPPDADANGCGWPVTFEIAAGTWTEAGGSDLVLVEPDIEFDTRSCREHVRKLSHIKCPDVAFVRAWVHGDPVGPCIQGDGSQPNHIRNSDCAGIAQQCDFVDIDAQLCHLADQIC